MSKIALSVNLNKIALIRNSREGNYPSVVEHGKICLDAGAAGLTVHPRPDQRHIRPQDVEDLAALVSEHPGTELNIEGNPFSPAGGSFPGLLALAEKTRPAQVTLVPDSYSQLTSDHGFDMDAWSARLKPVITQFKNIGARVSLFMDPEPEQIKQAKKLGADRIELYTGPFAKAFAEHPHKVEILLCQYMNAAQAATEVGLGVNAGHDLNLKNLRQFKHIPGLAEVSIGHALTVDALAMGLHNAIVAYLDVCNSVTR